ncbi:UNVERIFIED_CONTAM: hypothetical protein RMT77_008796 [Armadillidium vulgare]
MDIIHYKCALLGLICCRLAAYFKTEMLKVEYNAKYILFFEHVNFVCYEHTFHLHCRISKLPHFDFIVLNAILLREIHFKQMLVTFLKITEGETG